VTKRIDDFIAFMDKQASHVMAGNIQDADLLDEEDIEAMMNSLPELASMQMIMMSPKLALWFSFMRGVLWARYRAEAEHPINRALRDIKGLD